MLNSEGYKALYPTLGFPSTGTPSSLSQLFHHQARYLLTTSHLSQSHPLCHVCKSCHPLPCPGCCCERRPSAFVPSTLDHFLPLTSIAATNLEVRHASVNFHSGGSPTPGIPRKPTAPTGLKPKKLAMQATLSQIQVLHTVGVDVLASVFTPSTRDPDNDSRGLPNNTSGHRVRPPLTHSLPSVTCACRIPREELGHPRHAGRYRTRRSPCFILRSLRHSISSI